MQSFAVPCAWSESRLAYELEIVADEMNIEFVTLRDRALSASATAMHAHVLSGLAQKREAIEARLTQVAAEAVG